MSATSDTIDVLHVDDDPGLTDLVATFLEREDDRITVETATDVDEGLEILVDRDIDCIISDYDMPGRTGIEFLETVRRDRPDLPFVLYTGKGSEEVASDAIAAGVTDYLQKESGTDQYVILANRVVNAVERYQAEQTRTQLRAISDHSADAIVTIDADSRVRFANPTVEEYFGYTPSELRGERLTTVMPERYRESHLAALDRYVETGERTVNWSHVEFVGQHRDGTEIPLSVSFSEFRQDGERRFIGIMRDISERTRIEEDLREQKERFRQVAENIREVVWMSDTEREEIVYVNPAYEEVWGQSTGTLYEDPTAFLDAVHPEDRDRVRAALDTQADGEYDEEYRIVRPDGERRWIRDRAVPVRNDAGEVYRIVGIASDITERKEQERKRERMIDRVTDAIVEVDADWRFTMVNQQAEKLYGMDEESLLGRSFWEVCTGARDTRFEEEYRDVMETREPTSLVESFPGLDGWFDIECYPNRDGGVAFYFTEITDQRELEETNAVLSTLVNALPDGVLAEDESREVVTANRQMFDLFGMSGPPAEVVGADCERIAGREPVDDEVLELADGRTFERTYRPVELPDGNGHLWVYRDVTPHKRRERELERSRQQYRALAEHFPNGGVFLFDTDLRYRIARGEGLEARGLVPADFEGKRVDETFGGDVPEPFPDMCRAALDGETRTEEIPFMGRTYRVHTVPVRDTEGEIFAGLAVTQDITEHSTHERRLEALNRATEELFTAGTREEVAGIGVEIAREVLDLDANAIHLYDEEEGGLAPVVGTDAVVDLVGELPTFTAGDSIAWRVYEGGDALALDDVRADPDIHNPETPIRSELYLPLGEHGILIAGSPDPTAFGHRHELLGRILASNIATALTNVERTEQLRTREQELSRQNDRLEEFASVVSHDLRNPLNVAEGGLELVQEECDSEHLERIERAHDRMDALITDLLTLAREGETASDISPVDLAVLAENCWENVDTKDATLVVDVDRTIRADGSRLRQLFENLMRNAVEHSGGDVTVTVGGLDGGFYVEDDGPGIPPDERESVFETGYSTSDRGTGFGLSIVARIVEAHGWDISVADGSEGGARFEITGVGFARGAA